MLAINPNENRRAYNPWRCEGAELEEIENFDLSDDEEDAQPPKDPHEFKIFPPTEKKCPQFDELIFVKCKCCSSAIFYRSLKVHVESRHMGDPIYEKHPELKLFYKKPRPIFTPPLPPAPKPRASNSTSAFVTSRTQASASCSDDVFLDPNTIPSLTEQYLGWSNNPHGAFQMSPANISANIARTKPQIKTKAEKKFVIPANKPKAVLPQARYKAGSGVVKTAATARKTVQKLAKSVILPPVEKDEPYNQTFSFSAAGPLPSTSSFNMPSTSSFNMPSTSYQDMPSTSYDIPSTSSYAGGLLPCQPLEQTSLYSPLFHHSSIPSATVTSETQEKAPAIEKLVLRRVLQTDQTEPAEGSQSHQGLKGVSKNKKDSSQTYFMVVKNKDRQQQNLVAPQQQVPQQIDDAKHEKDAVEHKIRKLENHRTRLINKLFQELQNVKLKLEQCNRSKQQIENQLLEVKADLEETKRTTDFQNEALLKQNAKFENEIQMLKQRIEDLTSRLEQEEIYKGLSHPWNFADSHMSKQFQALEEQKLEYQRRIEELESESRELQNSSTEQRERFDAKLRQYFKLISDLKKRLDAQTAKSEELQIQRDYYEKHLPSQICFQVKSQLAAFQHQSPEGIEDFSGLLTPNPTPPSTSGIPLAETLLSDIQNNYIFQSQMSPESPEVFQQPQQQPTPEMMDEDEVS